MSLEKDAILRTWWPVGGVALEGPGERLQGWRPHRSDKAHANGAVARGRGQGHLRRLSGALRQLLEEGLEKSIENHFPCSQASR